MKKLDNDLEPKLSIADVKLKIDFVISFKFILKMSLILFLEPVIKSL
ncbi:hypothetical protein [Sebaldella sp. S0638]|nr:hypothetical protein [Sebaldella sp. S0638]MCP1226317.1 hypothetical protein [Sebaldella sp. S0638]